MRGPTTLQGAVYALVLATLSGLGLTWWTSGGDFQLGALHVGPWTARPLADQTQADRYSRARIARTGNLPLGPGEGLAFVARLDSTGARLDGACVYRIGPILPPARWWTLSLYDAKGGLIANPSERHGFASSAVFRGPDGEAQVVTAPYAQPGNWLPSAAGAVTLVLRLYDSPISTGLSTELGARNSIAMPDIERLSCPPGGNA